jgi:hypothetical protein
MIRYLQIGALVGLVAFGFWINHLWKENQRLSEENTQMILQAEKTAENLKLLVQQLDREVEYRQIAESALSQLNEVPDVVYSQRLSPEIQSVLDNFHTRIGR